MFSRLTKALSLGWLLNLCERGKTTSLCTDGNYRLAINTCHQYFQSKQRQQEGRNRKKGTHHARRLVGDAHKEVAAHEVFP